MKLAGENKNEQTGLESRKRACHKDKRGSDPGGEIMRPQRSYLLVLFAVLIALVAGATAASAD